MNNKEASFFPFHAINEFMTDEYRAQVIRLVLNELTTLPEELRAPIERITRKNTNIPGFRNSQKAPASLKVKPTIDAFEKNPTLVAAILAGWAGLHLDLRQQVYELLVSRGWEVLPPQADRSKLPGFMTIWYQGEDFETLYQAYNQAFPPSAVEKQAPVEQNDVSLMIVWVSARLPHEFVALPTVPPSSDPDQA